MILPPINIREWCNAVKISKYKVHVKTDLDSGFESVYLHTGKNPTTNNCLLDVTISPSQNLENLDSAEFAITIWDNPMVCYTFTMSKWCPDHIMAIIYSAIAYRALRPGTTVEDGNAIGWILKIIKLVKGSKIVGSTPKAVSSMYSEMSNSFLRAMECPFKSAVGNIKEYFNKYQNKITEDDIITWYREALASRVLED